MGTKPTPIRGQRGWTDSDVAAWHGHVPVDQDPMSAAGLCLRGAELSQKASASGREKKREPSADQEGASGDQMETK